ncbi:hypothetical protein C7I87_32575 [Mesorhizobium sp. SARCC-RB16n]|uniref:hypothetical protein n=1 Tax=Mesorhizobium sp. SARCC-RB16n TaxID=2116687 RepID=UPI00122F7BF6|nr:hypothetical protein [Mesorhizobium sp. SARCC-RB16n]KAA3442046.1 hypothetical protein C7I87_32575 [Mesorhizobium sp. SARCC-RB16n]
MFDWNRSCSYDEQQKRRFHTTGRSKLKKLAAELALPPGSYDLRSNKAGIAVSGEITLHITAFATSRIGNFQSPWSITASAQCWSIAVAPGRS